MRKNRIFYAMLVCNVRGNIAAVIQKLNHIALLSLILSLLRVMASPRSRSQLTLSAAAPRQLLGAGCARKPPHGGP
jgi:hypothetical protein